MWESIKNPDSSPENLPDIIIIIGLDFLHYSKDKCPQHLADCHKYLHKLMFPAKTKHQVPILVVSQVELKETFKGLYEKIPPNVLLIENTNIDDFLKQFIKDCDLEQDLV